MFRLSGEPGISTKADEKLKKHRLIRSFRLRIFLIIMAVGLISLAIMRHSLLYDGSRVTVDNMTSEMLGRMRILSDRISEGAFSDESKSNIIRSDMQTIGDIYESRIVVTDADLRVVYDSYGTAVGEFLGAKAALNCLRHGNPVSFPAAGESVQLAVPVKVTDAENRSQVGGIVFAQLSTEGVSLLAEEKGRRSSIIFLLMGVFLTAFAAFVSVLLVRPFERITKEIRQVASFEDEDFVESGYMETEEIAEAFNEMKSRMKMLDDSRKEFVGNVSHELKTPMASIKVLADSINMQQGAPIEMYQDFMQDISDEIDRENKIISDLLALVNMDKGASALNIENKDVNIMLEGIIKRLGPLAKKNEVDIVFESVRQVNADVDEMKLGSAFMNLIENGIKYNKRPGVVRVKLDADHRFFTVEISDTGIGIPEEERLHIFERFYRVDKSHSREIGGTGLGLSIARRTILLHKGTIKVESIVDEGTVFTVRIPVVYIADESTSNKKKNNGRRKA